MSDLAKKYTGTPTYVESLLPQGDSTQVTSCLGFDDNDKDWYVYSINFFKERTADLFREANLQFYRPTYAPDENKNSKAPAILKSKTLNYVFVPATEEQVLEFSRLYDITPIYRRHTRREMESIQRIEGQLALERVKLEEKLFDLKDRLQDENLPADQHISLKTEYSALFSRYVRDFGESRRRMSSRFTIIPKRQMHSLMIVVEGYEREVDFHTSDEMLVQKGDRVRVISGPCAGVEGILMTNQGCRKGGRVFVSVEMNRGVITKQIPDECIQVLEFSRNTNHVTRCFKAVEALLDQCLTTVVNGNELTSFQRTSLEFMLVRYSCLTNLTVANEAKLTAFRYVAHSLLFQFDKAEAALQTFLTKTQNEKTYRDNVRRSPATMAYIERWKQRLYPQKAS